MELVYNSIYIAKTNKIELYRNIFNKNDRNAQQNDKL